MKLANIFLYFLIAIIIVGTIGIWLPTLLQYFKNETISELDLLQNSVTYFITIIVAGCVDIILNVLRKSKHKNIPGVILLMILFILISIGLVIVSSITIINKNLNLSYWLVSFGVAIAWSFWWISNWNRSELDPNSALGGNV